MSSSERCKASCTIEGYQEDEDEDMADDDQVEGKLSIQQILEGMTNEFNKAIKESDLKKAEPITAEHVEVRNEETAAQVEGDQPAVNNESNTETLTEPLNKDPNERYRIQNATSCNSIIFHNKQTKRQQMKNKKINN